MAEQKFFKMLWEGNLSPENVLAEMVSDSLSRSEDSEACIEREWQKLLATGFKAWPNDTKPTRFRFCGVREKGGKLIVTLDPCVSYRDFIGSHSSEFLEQFGEDYNPHPLAVSVVIVTRDVDGLKVMLTVRKNVDYKPGGYHASIGGFMDTHKEDNVVSCVFREVKEESGVESDEVKDLCCVSVAYNLCTHHTDIIFAATTNLESGEIKKRTKDDENESLFFIPATRQSIEELITKTSHANVIIAMVGLLLLGKSLPVESDEHEQPEEWHKRMLQILAEESKDYDSPQIRAELEARDIARFQAMVKKNRL